ncbi:MAG: nucleoside deaminase [Bacteroidota bacterium]
MLEKKAVAALSPLDQQFLQRAQELAILSGQKGFHPFGTVLAFKERIVWESEEVCIPYSDPTAHPELTVISQYCRAHQLISLEGYTLYTNVEPCVMCSGAIHWARITKVVFGFSQAQLQSLSGGKPKPSCHPLINQGKQRVEIIGPVFPDAALEEMRAFPFTSKKDQHRAYYKNQDS